MVAPRYLSCHAVHGKLIYMSFDRRMVFANLVEKERIKGHHSPEGQAIRTLSRALNGWSSGSLSQRDVLVMCDQAVEDWLNARLKRSQWSIGSVPALVPAALANHWLTQSDAERLLKLHDLRRGSEEAEELSTQELEAALEFYIGLIDKHWEKK
jgi:hypothetical protein